MPCIFICSSSQSGWY